MTLAPAQPTAATLAAPDAAAAPSSAPPVAAEARPAAEADSAAAPPLAPTQAGPAAPTALPVAVGQPVAMPAHPPSAAPAVDAATAAHYAAYGMAYGGSPHAPHYAQGISGIGAHQGIHPGAHPYGYTAEQIAAHYSDAMLMQEATAAHDAMQAYGARFPGGYSPYVYGGPESVAAYTHTQGAHPAYAAARAAQQQVRDSAILRCANDPRVAGRDCGRGSSHCSLCARVPRHVRVGAFWSRVEPTRSTH